MALIGQNQQTTFTNPQNGQAPDADVVRGNDNATVAKLNAHDADGTIHIQSGTLAARPSAATAGDYATYTDQNAKLYRSNGVIWVEVPYARITGDTFLGGVSVATGGLSVTGNTAVVGNLDVTGTITGATLVGPVTVAASDVTAGTFAAGAFVFPGNLTATSGTTALGVTNTTRVKAARGTTSGSGASVSFAAANHHRVTMTGNGVLALTAVETGVPYTVEVLQDATGARTISSYTSSVGTVVWAGGVAPTLTATANRKDIFTFFCDGTNTLAVVFGQNFASTG